VIPNKTHILYLCPLSCLNCALDRIANAKYIPYGQCFSVGSVASISLAALMHKALKYRSPQPIACLKGTAKLYSFETNSCAETGEDS
jgi:hypothetical protein